MESPTIVLLSPGVLYHSVDPSSGHIADTARSDQKSAQPRSRYHRAPACDVSSAKHIELKLTTLFRNSSTASRPRTPRSTHTWSLCLPKWRRSGVKRDATTKWQLGLIGRHSLVAWSERLGVRRGRSKCHPGPGFKGLARLIRTKVKTLLNC